MGCCASKYSDQDEEEERARLLDRQRSDGHHHPYGMISPSYSELNQVRELESLQRIVERTAGILIDIPSTGQTDRLQEQEAQKRFQEYQEALRQTTFPQDTIRKLYTMTSVQTSSVALAGPDANNHNHSHHHLSVLDSHSIQGSGSNGLGQNGSRSAVSSAASSVAGGQSSKAASVRDVLSEKTVDAKTLGWMANAMGELQQATEAIDVQDVGDLIVGLPTV